MQLSFKRSGGILTSVRNRVFSILLQQDFWSMLAQMYCESNQHVGSILLSSVIKNHDEWFFYDGKNDGLVAFENVRKSFKPTYCIYGKFIFVLKLNLFINGECMSFQLYRTRKMIIIITRYLFQFMKQHVRDQMVKESPQ